MAALINRLHEIIAFADGKGLTLGLENRYHYYELPVFGEMDTLLGEFKQEWVEWQFDIRHLQVLTELVVDRLLTDLEIATGIEALEEAGCITLFSGGSDNA